MKRKLGLFMLGALIFVSAGCGKNNIFSFAHSAGSNTSTKSLSSDAAQAFQNKDFNKAFEYYKKILESDPNNSEAIYGYAAAELAATGMDIASLVSNLVQTKSAPQFNRLSPALAYAAQSPAYSSTLIPQSIINNRTAIENAVNDVLGSGYLLKIIQGKADGTIAADNPDVNINIAFCLVLKAALKVYDSGITFNSDYTVVGSNTSSNLDTINSAGQDIASAYQRLIVVSKKLNLGSDASINKINSDIHDLFERLNAKTGMNANINTDYYFLYGSY